MEHPVPDMMLTSQDTAVSKIDTRGKAHSACADTQVDRDGKRQSQYRVMNPTTGKVLEERRIRGIHSV